MPKDKKPLDRRFSSCILHDSAQNNFTYYLVGSMVKSKCRYFFI